MISNLICLNNSPFCSKYNGELDLVQFDVARRRVRRVLLYSCAESAQTIILSRAFFQLLFFLHRARNDAETLHFKLCECQRCMYINKHAAKCGENIDTVTSCGVSSSKKRYTLFCFLLSKSQSQWEKSWLHTHTLTCIARSNTLIQSSTCTLPSVEILLYYCSQLFSRET